MSSKVTPKRRFPIFTALALAAALALIALDFTSDAPSYAVGAHNEDVNATLRAMASDGIDIGIKSILSRTTDTVLHRGPESFTTKLAGVRLRILVQDEAGKADLNTATPELLTRVFIFAGAQTTEAQNLADRVVAFRSQQRSPSEVTQIRQPTAKNGRFKSVTELLQIPGVSEQMFLNMRRYITIHSGLKGIDPDVTAPELLQALPPITAEVRRRLDIVRARVTQASSPRNIEPSDPYFAASPGKVFTITCAADMEGKAIYIQNATVVLRDGERPYDVLERWTGGRISLPAMTASLEKKIRKAFA